MKSKLITIALIALLTINLACTKGELIRAATDVLSSVQSAQPLINQFLPSAAPKIGQAVTIAGKLKEAIAASDEASALGLLSNLIPTFQSIVRDDLVQIKDPNVRTQIMAALALADIGLHLLVNRLNANAPQAMTHSRDLAEFMNQPVWGERYRVKK